MKLVNDQEKMSLWKFVAQERVLSLGQSGLHIYFTHMMMRENVE
jgi:hypothetical protein